MLLFCLSELNGSLYLDCLIVVWQLLSLNDAGEQTVGVWERVSEWASQW